MSKKMLISATVGESRVAIVENGVLQDLHVDSAERGRIKGNIYKAQIVKVEPAIQACFIDYGASRHGFLTFSDIARARIPQLNGPAKRARLEEVLRPGMQLMVQCIKEPAGSKGAAFTTYISLPGRYLVLLPFAETTGGVSRKIEDESERKKLRALLSGLGRDKDYSLIIRTVGLGRNKIDLERDLHYLDRFWLNIQQSFEETGRPGLVFQEQNVVVRSIRDYYTNDMKEVLIDNADAFGAVEEYVKATMPRYVKRFRLYKGSEALFNQFNLNQQIEQAYRKRVRLPSGGAIVIEQTEALVSIDVNSGKALQGRTMEETALTTNLEAAEVIARQLRLRDLGGLIVIDFIDLREARNQRNVETTLRQALRDDKARYTLGKISRFGLLEMSRQRIQGTIASSSHDRCPFCHGNGFVRSASSSSLQIMSRLRELANDPQTGAIRAAIPRATALYLLNDKRHELAELEQTTGVRMEIVPSDISPDEIGTFSSIPGPKRNGGLENGSGAHSSFASSRPDDWAQDAPEPAEADEDTMENEPAPARRTPQSRQRQAPAPRQAPAERSAPAERRAPAERQAHTQRKSPVDRQADSERTTASAPRQTSAEQQAPPARQAPAERETPARRSAPVQRRQERTATSSSPAQSKEKVNPSTQVGRHAARPAEAAESRSAAPEPKEQPKPATERTSSTSRRRRRTRSTAEPAHEEVAAKTNTPEPKSEPKTVAAASKPEVEAPARTKTRRRSSVQRSKKPA
jgi:ribonuclease E